MLLLQAGQGFGLAQLFFPLAILAVFYFFIIRPGQVKETKQKNFLENLNNSKFGIFQKVNKFTLQNTR